MQNIFCNISSCKCASTRNYLYYKSHPFRSGLPIMFVYITCDSAGMVGFCARRAQRALFQTHSALTDAVFYTEFFNEHKSYYSVITALANSPNRSMRSEFCLLNSRCSKSFFLIERSVVFNTSSIATLRSCAEPMPLRFCKKL